MRRPTTSLALFADDWEAFQRAEAKATTAPPVSVEHPLSETDKLRAEAAELDATMTPRERRFTPLFTAPGELRTIAAAALDSEIPVPSLGLALLREATRILHLSAASRRGSSLQAASDAIRAGLAELEDAAAFEDGPSAR